METDDEDTPYNSTRNATFSGMFWNAYEQSTYFGVPGAEVSVSGPMAVNVFELERSCSGIPDLPTVTTFTVNPWQVELG
jgi:hypothetical protein